MTPSNGTPQRREFLADLGLAGAALALGALPAAAMQPAAPRAAPAPAGPWDVSWLDRVRRARHRALFDAPTDAAGPMLAARYLDNVAAVYGAAPPEVAAVVNLRTQSAKFGLADAMWLRFPIGEDANLKDAAGAPVRRNPDFAPAPGVDEAMAGISLQRLQARGALLIVCDFALGHLARRIAEKVGATEDAVHAEFRQGLLPGAYLVPSGIFGMTEAQNAGCAFVPG